VHRHPLSTSSSRHYLKLEYFTNMSFRRVVWNCSRAPYPLAALAACVTLVVRFGSRVFEKTDTALNRKRFGESVATSQSDYRGGQKRIWQIVFLKNAVDYFDVWRAGRADRGWPSLGPARAFVYTKTESVSESEREREAWAGVAGREGVTVWGGI